MTILGRWWWAPARLPLRRRFYAVHDPLMGRFVCPRKGHTPGNNIRFCDRCSAVMRWEKETG